MSTDSEDGFHSFLLWNMLVMLHSVSEKQGLSDVKICVEIM